MSDSDNVVDFLRDLASRVENGELKLTDAQMSTGLDHDRDREKVSGHNWAIWKHSGKLRVWFEAEWQAKP